MGGIFSDEGIWDLYEHKVKRAGTKQAEDEGQRIAVQFLAMVPCQAWEQVGASSAWNTSGLVVIWTLRVQMYSQTIRWVWHPNFLHHVVENAAPSVRMCTCIKKWPVWHTFLFATRIQVYRDIIPWPNHWRSLFCGFSGVRDDFVSSVEVITSPLPFNRLEGGRARATGKWEQM